MKNAFVYAPSAGNADKIKIGKGINVLDDLTSLLSTLLPKELKNLSRLKFKRSSLALSNSTEAIYIYHQLIDLGKKMGLDRNPSETSTEFQPRLFKTLQHKLVSSSTKYFELALYGNSEISDKQLLELKGQLAELKKEVKQKNTEDY